jgi:hypothetical protein
LIRNEFHIEEVIKESGLHPRYHSPSNFISIEHHEQSATENIYPISWLPARQWNLSAETPNTHPRWI